MVSVTHVEIRSILAGLRGQPCWYVSFGGAVRPSFQLALGDRVRRRFPIKNPAHPPEYREFEGTFNLLVWCSWRLDGPEGPLTSSDDTDAEVAAHLAALQGARVRSAVAAPPAWDLKLTFWNRLTLHVFCDHVPGDPSADGNWELWTKAAGLCIGPGSQVEWNPREATESAEAPHEAASEV